MKRIKLLALISALMLVFTACTSDDGGDETTTTAADGGSEDNGNGDTGGATLTEVQDRGTLNCGVNDAVPGFGFRDPDGNFSGFDVDFCKALAVAVLGDAEAVNYVPLNAQQRFTALQSGEIDV
ncbi:MAG: transporter substrate-binding domain-containing protein, partial [Acidimicrobiia bacterium]